MDTLLSIYSLYNWDNTIFDNLVIPEGMDKDIVVDTIMLELAELEILYNDPNFMKFALGSWSKKELQKWTDLYATTLLDYDPIENYNRTETSTDTETRNLINSNNETRDLKVTNNATVTVDNDVTNGGEDVITKRVSGFDAEGLVERESVTSTFGSTTATDNVTETEQEGGDTGTVSNIMSDSGTVTNGRTSNVKGNIGVTTSQQMIQQERNIVEFNPYDYIVTSFKYRFCVMVY